MTKIRLRYADGVYRYYRVADGEEWLDTHEVPDEVVALWDVFLKSYEVLQDQLLALDNARARALEEKECCEHGVNHDHYCRECAHPEDSR